MRRIGLPRLYAAEVVSGVLLLSVLWLGSRTNVMAPRLRDGDGAQEKPERTVHINVDSLRPPSGSEPESQTCAPIDSWGIHLPEADGWASLTGPRVEAVADAEKPEVAAIRLPAGAAVFVRNSSEEPIAFRLSVRLPRGRYAVDRLVQSEGGASAERLQSVVCTASRPAEKPGAVQPRTVVVYRFVNPVVSSGAAYNRALRAIANLRSGYAAQYRRLVGALAECPWNIAQAQACSTSSDPTPLLEHVHRALLTVRHAQALCTNGVGLRRIPAGIGERISTELDALESWLTESSVAALCLVPGAKATPVAGGAGSYQVAVTVRNAGPRPVTALRLWAKGTEDARVEPSDAVVFPTLKPGEQASATFQVTLPEGAAPSELSGHVGYVARNAPAHLRVTCY